MSKRSLPPGSNSTHKIAIPNRPLTYFDDLYQLFQSTAQTNADLSSPIIKIENVRLGHLMSLLPLSQTVGTQTSSFSSLSLASPSSSSSSSSSSSQHQTLQQPSQLRIPVEPLLLSMDVAAFLAMYDFNARSSHIVPTLTDEIGDCNFYLTLEQRDSQFSPMVAVQQWFAGQVKTSNNNNNNNNSNQMYEDRPTMLGIVGAYRSAVSSELAELGGAYGTPIISPSSTSERLDNPNRYPTFARTVPTNLGDAEALCLYWSQQLGVETMGVLYVEDDFGTYFYEILTTVAPQFQLSIQAVAYTTETIRQAVQEVGQTMTSNYRFMIPAAGSWQALTIELYRQGLMGPDTHWVIAESGSELIGTTLSLLATNSSSADQQQQEGQQQDIIDLAKAINGTGCLIIRPPPDKLALFQEEWQALWDNETLVDYYKSLHVDGAGGGTSAELSQLLDLAIQQSQPTAYMYSLLSYDAVLAYGMAACKAQDLSTNANVSWNVFDFMNVLKNVEFYGASEQVTFNNITGTRDFQHVEYHVLNLLTDMNDTTITFRGPESIRIRQSQPHFIVSEPFLYPGWTTKPPALTLTVPYDMNLIGTGVLYFSCILCGIALLLPVAAGIWTYRNRNLPCVKASQPLFLALLCIGTFFIGASIIPLTFQEPMNQKTLNAGCMSFPWLLASGFSLAQSALFSKIYRINQVFAKAQKFQRVKIRAVDVLKPLLLLMFLNVAFLTAWTITAPLTWVRKVTAKDEFGRPTSSFGSCDPQSQTTWLFLSLLLIINMLAIVVANYQSYLARNLPSDWNESFYVSLTNFILLETGILAAPVLFLVSNDPTAFLLVRSLSVFIIALAVMLPAFLPKIIVKKKEKKQKVLRLNRDVSVYKRRGSIFGGFGNRFPSPTPHKEKFRLPSADVAFGSGEIQGGGSHHPVTTSGAGSERMSVIREDIEKDEPNDDAVDRRKIRFAIAAPPLHSEASRCSTALMSQVGSSRELSVRTLIDEMDGICEKSPLRENEN